MRAKTIILSLLATCQLHAADIKEGCFTYSITSPTTAIVEKVFIDHYDENGSIISMGDTTRLEVPETIDFYGHRLTVTAIGRAAFQFIRVDTVVLPNTIREIGDYAFQNCPLKQINLPDGIEKISDGCFYYCQLQHITLPAQLKTIGWQAFTACPLKELRLPKGLTSIGSDAFSECKEIKELDLPDSLKTIGSRAFNSCEKLEKITTHGDIETLSYDCFNSCQKLKTVTWGGKVRQFGGFSFCTNLEAITIPEGVQSIASSTFSGCTALKEIALPQSVRELGQSVFNGCTSLKEITIPAGVRNIQSWTFNGCTKLETLTLGENVENINSDALDGSHLKKLYVRSRKPSNYGSSSFSQSIVDLFNNAVLYIPTGTKASYAAAEFWKNFRNVEEFNTGQLYDVITLTIREGGQVSCNGQTFGEGESTLLVPASQPVTFTIKPDADHAFSSAEQRYEYGIDYLTNDFKDNQLTVKTIKQHSNIWFFFESAKVNIDVLQNEQGRVRLTVSKNQRYACRIIEEEGWRVNSITFNGADITNKAGAGNYIQTPVVKADAVIRIAFEQDETGINQAVQERIRVLGDDNGLTITQTEPGERIDIYLTDGRLVRSLRGNGTSLHVNLPAGAVYLVKTKTKTIKIRL